MQSSVEQLNEVKTQLITREGVYRLVPHAEYTKPKTTSYAPNGATLGSNSSSTPVKLSFAKVLNEFHFDRFSHSSLNDVLHPSVIVSSNTSTLITNSNNSISPTATNTDSGCLASSNHDHQSDQLKLRHKTSLTNGTLTSAEQFSERICFNIGQEIFIYMFNGLQPADLTKLVNRRNYKSTAPTCHDFYSNIDQRISLLLIGLSAGQIQLIDMYRWEINKFYNQDRLIEKSKVTCIRWLPNSKSNFLVSYASGQMYLYKEDLTCGTATPNYQQFKSGEGFTIYTCKTKSSRNPIFRWSIGEGAIHEFEFSPCGEFVATVSQDGFLRVFHYDRMELVGQMRSYFGGLLCLGWSPDSKFIVTGGEDDLITVWSMIDKRVIARGQGHKSWVNAVTFDPFMTTFGDDCDHNDFDGETNETGANTSHHSDNNGELSRCSRSNEFNITNYRIGSVGQDTQICLWDLTDDIIQQSLIQPSTLKSRSSLLNASTSSTTSNAVHQTNATSNTVGSQCNNSSKSLQPNGLLCSANSNAISPNQSTTNHNSSSQQQSHHHHHNPFFNSLIKAVKFDHKRNAFSLSSRSFSDKNTHRDSNTHHYNHKSGSNTLTKVPKDSGSSVMSHSAIATTNGSSTLISSTCDPTRLLGTVLCPRLCDVPMLEPHVCKKVAHERLTALVFRKDYLVIANQDGKVSIFSRPNNTNNLKISSPNASLASDVNEIACDDNSTAIV